ncbi:unnamed protein product [Toxocara canis]|uniref:Transposase n=1 Tax=Toxocara canis TaxID=6265 RepID=A0A183URY5_TOXCA|nr:unnamed protein product [Toxocara canis]
MRHHSNGPVAETGIRIALTIKSFETDPDLPFSHTYRGAETSCRNTHRSERKIMVCLFGHRGYNYLVNTDAYWTQGISADWPELGDLLPLRSSQKALSFP